MAAGLEGICIVISDIDMRNNTAIWWSMYKLLWIPEDAVKAHSFFVDMKYANIACKGKVVVSRFAKTREGRESTDS